jgi:hypothetical protein
MKIKLIKLFIFLTKNNKVTKENKKMSITPKKESDSNNNNSNICTSEEPKIFQEQRSLLEPSTELGSNSYLYNIL